MIEWEKTETGKCDYLSEVPEGADVIYIGDKEVIGRCESCGKYLVETYLYVEDINGVVVCNDCYHNGDME